MFVREPIELIQNTTPWRRSCTDFICQLFRSNHLRQTHHENKPSTPRTQIEQVYRAFVHGLQQQPFTCNTALPQHGSSTLSATMFAQSTRPQQKLSNSPNKAPNFKNKHTSALCIDSRPPPANRGAPLADPALWTGGGSNTIFLSARLACHPSDWISCNLLTTAPCVFLFLNHAVSTLVPEYHQVADWAR